MKGYYSLIQFCPDLSRAEAANVGVLLFCPESRFIQAMTSSSNDRVRRFFREYSFDLDRLNALKRSIEGRLQTCANDIRTLEDLEKFIATRANEILITSPRPMKVVEPSVELQELYNELVGGRKRERSATDAMISELREVFNRPNFRGRIEFSKQIQLPVVERVIEMPFAYRNGILNLVQATSLSSIMSRATNTALQLVSEGQLIERHPVEGQDAKLTVVYRFNDFVSGTFAGRVKSLFDDFRIAAVPEDQIESFANKVDQEAH